MPSIDFAQVGIGTALLFAAPFIVLLGSIAVLPLVIPHVWERNRNRAIVSLGLAAPIALYFLLSDVETLGNTLLDYAAFIALLAALFTISGNIYVRGTFVGRPRVNAGFLLVGALLANFIGTTGASMLLIRPLIRANAARKHKVHTFVFFIFLVSNCAGLLTPLGDPPLFLGFIRGVPFAWTLRLFPQWLVMVAALLALYTIIDSIQFRKDAGIEGKAGGRAEVDRNAPAARPGLGASSENSDKFGLQGAHNFLLLGLVVGLIIFSGQVVYHMEGPAVLGESFGAVASKVVQMIGMGLAALVSYKSTGRDIRRRNRFSFGPITEVAILFAGIFVTMMPVLLVLEAQGAKLGVQHPWQFFWITGALSGVLDNAPTYLTFTSLAKGVLGLPHGEGLATLVNDPTGAIYLAAISVGAVFMGANTYIGNGPNFMVKAIAEEAGVKMPSFFGYLLWSGSILIPLFVVLTLLFFRG